MNLETENQNESNKKSCYTYVESTLLELQKMKPHVIKVLKKGAIYFITGSIVQFSSDMLSIFGSNLPYHNYWWAVIQRSFTHGVQLSCAAQSLTIAKYIRSKNSVLPFSSNYFGSLFYSSLGISALNCVILTPFINFKPGIPSISFRYYPHYVCETTLHTLGFVSGYSTTKKYCKDKYHIEGKLEKHLLSYTAGKTCESILMIPYSRYIFGYSVPSQIFRYIKTIPTFINNGAFTLAASSFTKKFIPG